LNPIYVGALGAAALVRFRQKRLAKKAADAETRSPLAQP
jgi:hypothetical protein